MIQVVLDKYAQIDFLGCLEELEICNESGQVVARLTPDPAYREKMYAIARTLIGEEELRKARQQKGGRTLAEIMKRLESQYGPLHSRLDSNGGTTIGRPVVDGEGS